MSKYSNLLTMILVVLTVAILGIVGYFAFSILNSKEIDSNALSAIEEFDSATKVVKKVEKKTNTNAISSEVTNSTTTSSLEEIANLVSANKFVPEPSNETEVNNQDTVTNENQEERTEPEKVYYEGYEIKGYLKIPKTKVNYPVLETVTEKTLSIALGLAYGPGLNEVGNTTIFGHNYRNGKFFSNNKKLSNGDKILVTDKYGDEVTYIIYRIYETDASDAEYMLRDTEGRREISLQTCTDDSNGRIIIWAAEEGSM